MDGIVIIDKPQDWTSQDVTARLRRVYQTRRIGHGGTLDPMATGVLPVFVGRATRAVEFFEHAEKTYETVLQLGITTDTEDITGQVLTQQPVCVTEEQVRKALDAFRGEIQQVPPMYSALKVNGQKLYDLARKGQQVERKPRPVTIHELDLLEFSGQQLRLRVRCSKGTYIRTLCKDIGQALGCGGTWRRCAGFRPGVTPSTRPCPWTSCSPATSPSSGCCRWTACLPSTLRWCSPPTRKSAAATATPFPSSFPRILTGLTARKGNFSCWQRWKMASCPP